MFNEQQLIQAIAIAQSNNFKISGSEISLIINKVFADVLGKEV